MVQMYANKSPASFCCDDRCFLELRAYIADKYNKEFGILYARFNNALTFNNANEIKEYEDKIAQHILDDPSRAKDFDIYLFLFNSKKESKVSNHTCKKIYDLIANDDGEYIGVNLLRYMEDKENDFESLKELLLYCYEHRCKLRIKME